MCSTLHVPTAVLLFVGVACANPAEPDDPPRDGGVAIHDAGPPRDAGPTRDAGEVPRDGGEVVRDGGEDPRDGGARDGGPTDGGERVIEIAIAYSATAERLLHAELYLTSSNIAREKVSPPLAGGPGEDSKGFPEIDGVGRFAWTDDGDAIVYAAQQDTFDFYELYAAPIPSPVGTATASKLSPGGDSQVRSWTDVPFSNLLLLEQSPVGVSGSRKYAVEKRFGAEPVQISTGLASREVFSPTRAQVVFHDIIVSASDRDLWFVDLQNAPYFAERVNPGANFGWGLAATWSPDGDVLFYNADENVDRVYELYRVAINGTTLGPRVPMMAPLPSTQRIDALAYAPDGSRVLLRGDLTTDNVFDLYTFDPAATPPIVPTRITTLAFPGVLSGVERFQFSPDGSMVLYEGDHDVARRDELWVVPADGSAPPARVHTPLGDQEYLINPRWVSDTMVLYTAGPSGQYHLYATPIVGGVPGTPIDLGTDSLRVGEALSAPSPSGRYVAFLDDAMELNLVDLDASPIGTLRIGPAVGGCWGPEDQLAVIASYDDEEKRELYFVEDLRAPDPIRVSGPLIEGGEVVRCAFPPSDVVE